MIRTKNTWLFRLLCALSCAAGVAVTTAADVVNPRPNILWLTV